MVSAAHALNPFRTSEFLGVLLWATAAALKRFFPLLTKFRLDEEEGEVPWQLRLQRPSSSGGCAVPLEKLGGIALVAAGTAAIKWVHLEMGKHEQTRQPGSPTTRLIRTGPFRWSRNPTYAAIVFLVMPGLGVALQNLWMLALVPVAVVLFYYVMVAEEEAYLKGKFGDEWDSYRAITPRWI